MVKREKWDDLRVQANGGGIPTWHRDVLAERLRRLEIGAEPVSPWAKAKERIRTQAQAERSSGSASRL